LLQNYGKRLVRRLFIELKNSQKSREINDFTAFL